MNLLVRLVVIDKENYWKWILENNKKITEYQVFFVLFFLSTRTLSSTVINYHLFIRFFAVFFFPLSESCSSQLEAPAQRIIEINNTSHKEDGLSFSTVTRKTFPFLHGLSQSFFFSFRLIVSTKCISFFGHQYD